MATVSHYNAQTVLDIFGPRKDVTWADSPRLQAIVDRNRSQLPRGSQIIVRGQIATMQSSFVAYCRPGVCYFSDLSADCGEFSVVARSIYHYLGAACGLGRHCLDFVRHAYHNKRACFTGSIMCMAWPRRIAFLW